MSWRAIVVCVVGCSSPPHHAKQPPALANTAPPPPARVQPAEPTLATAGAKTCALRDAILLGPHGEGHTILAFDRSGGLAVWKRDKTVLALQAVGLDGQKLGSQMTVAVPEGIEPHKIYALGGSFVVLLRRWDWQTKDLNWWGFAVDRSGRAAKPPAEIGLTDLDIEDAELVDDRRIKLRVGPGYISKYPNTPPRWQALTVTPSGLESHAMAADTPRSAPVHAPTTLAFSVTNRAVPPGRGAGGTIYEAMGRPTLERTRDGQPVGERVDLVWRNNPIAYGMNIADYIVWSGTHFVYPFWDDDGGPTHDKYVERLLPIDCRPPH